VLSFVYNNSYLKDDCLFTLACHEPQIISGYEKMVGNVRSYSYKTLGKVNQLNLSQEKNTAHNLIAQFFSR